MLSWILHKKGVISSLEQGEMATASDSEVPTDKEKFTFFYRTDSPFSQFHPATFTVDGVEFNCAEQFMMYNKAVVFGDKEIADEILTVTVPRDHKALGRQVKNFSDDVWKEKCKDIVKTGNFAKFRQNPDLLEKLLDTKGTTLVEASPRDRRWGIGLGEKNPKAWNRKTWRGSNWLGEILTEIREEIIAEQSRD